ncbi:hypothetical protein [Shewanella pneumatophori]|uniref:Outer membrane protein beta-barrel domain-containing protein n=1 Tax=Shewanella pneumatophori TaxID=314092 RepID=A0A9X1ZE47_9GAMM|nr:hypothetical protein [Shewanella pneumatophori]MCL1140604.1 hypothetical protein [Shewanella pneumatophori]
MTQCLIGKNSSNTKVVTLLGIGSLLTFSSSAAEHQTQMAKHAPKSNPAAVINAPTPITDNPSESEADLVWKGISSSFMLPIEEWNADTPWYKRWSASVNLGYPLVDTPAVLPANSTTGPSNQNFTASLSLKYAIIGNWFVSATAYHYFDNDLQQAWNPDFTYVFGYSDWRPYTFSLLYSNYGGNRFNPSDGVKHTEFSQGTWSLGWKFPVTKPFIDWLSFTDDGAIGCQIDYNYTPEYFDLESVEYKTQHQTVSLGCKYSIVGNWYVNATAFYYLDSAQKQPWNPDFTYGFGYFDWRPGTITVQYNNYSGNRWNSADRGPDTGRFKDGSISISYSFKF